MSEENIFNGQGADAPKDQAGTPQPAETNPVQQPVIPQELADWVGPGKKYASVDEVYKAFPNAQNHIQTQQQKIAELEAELNKRKSAEEVLQEIRSRETEQQKPTSQGVEVNEQVLSEIVDRRLDMRSKQQIAQDNLKVFKEQFGSVYGDKAADMYTNLSKETGLSFDELNAMASKSPQAVLKMAGVNQPKAKTSFASVEGSVNTQALSANAPKTDQLSARVSPYANSRELADGWRRAGEIVKQKLQG